MADDIHQVTSGNLEQHASMVVGFGSAGAYYDTDDESVLTKPTWADVNDKFDDRWDEPRYYAGDTPN